MCLAQGFHSWRLKALALRHNQNYNELNLQFDWFPLWTFIQDLPVIEMFYLGKRKDEDAGMEGQTETHRYCE